MTPYPESPDNKPLEPSGKFINPLEKSEKRNKISYELGITGILILSNQLQSLGFYCIINPPPPRALKR